MATTSNATEELPPHKIRFVQNHRPALDAGDYTITIEQKIEVPEQIDKDNVFTTTRKFSVSGPRFNLNPQDVQAVFPPAGSLGEHSNVLPHIIFGRSTLPWERMADYSSEDVPWLALLLFDEDEAPTPVDPTKIEAHMGSKLQTITLMDLKTADRAKFPKVYDRNDDVVKADEPYLKLEFGDHDEDKVTVIDIPQQLLQQIMPAKGALRWLAHVRQTKADADKAEVDEVAVIICNRLPKAGGVSVVHLVSVEGRYGDQTFDYQTNNPDDLVRLVSLYSWRFACVSQKQSFKGLLMHLNHPLLFNIQASPAIVGFLNRETSIIPDDLKQAFVQSNHLLPNNFSVKERSLWKLSDGGRYYLISNNRVYNQAGKPLFSLASSLSDSSEPQTVLDQVKTAFENGHQLSNKARIVTDAAGHWWLGVDDPKYFIYREIDRSIEPPLDRLYVYYLDPDHSSTLRLSRPERSDQATKEANETADKYLKQGWVPLPHAMRQGNKSVSWYHGPLIPGENKTGGDMPLPVRTADQLVRYDATYGMFDVSYAAAWELGRLLALQNKQVSLALANWKRSHVQQQKDAEQQLAHLSFDGPSADLDLPQIVKEWFVSLAWLQGVPFNYLVPDEAMLPQESIRFFQVDRSWLECLLDGAFSIGRVLSSDRERDQGHREKVKAIHQRQPLSGFLLRSDLVAGWPDLLVDGTDKVVQDNQDIPTEDKLTARIDRLSKNILVCLFEGLVQAVDIHQKPETLHFGVNLPDDEHTTEYKKLRDRKGEESGSPVDIPWSDKAKKVIDIEELANCIKSKLGESEFTAAQFALEMIEGVEKVRFVKRAS